MAVRALQSAIVASEDRRLGTVTLRVRARWASLAQELAERLLDGVNEFNFQTRKSQASVERRFIEDRLTETGRELLAAETRMQEFLSRNRNLATSPELLFQRDRLQRELTLRQQIYTSLVQSREDARIREVRDTPVITVIETPSMPLRPESRRVALNVVGGAIAAGLLGVLFAVALEALERAHRNGNEFATRVLVRLNNANGRLRSLLGVRA
jgi:uncharacterized protein involved in exopolysaccharide biosynthesis